MVGLRRSVSIFNLLPTAGHRAIILSFAVGSFGCATGSIATWADDPSAHSTYEPAWAIPIEQAGAVSASSVPVGALFFQHNNHPLVRRDLPIGGAASCAAAGCHGGPKPGVAAPTAERGSEYPLWFENDPHARSWRTICGPKSVAIMQRLKITDGTSIRDQAGFDNCLACHNTTGHFSGQRTTSRLREGVGCSACHGPDGGWVDRHYQRDWHPAFESPNGFVTAADLFVRARMCASCHVGDADRDMNHDIIAAGHPALRYEFATYHARLPKHWRDAAASDMARFEAQLWLAGQVAGLDASLTLLETRAGKLHSVSAWPELAEYDCASCHHQLKLRDLDAPKQRSRPLGLARYSQWNRAGFELLLAELERSGQAGPATAQLRDAMRDVEKIMESNYRPDPTATTAASRGARQALDEWMRGEGQTARFEFDAHQLVELAIKASRSADSTSNWESAVQFYLATVAGRAAWTKTPETQKNVHKLQSALKFPHELAASSFPFDDPKTQRPTRDELRTLIEAIGQSLTPAAFELE